jgi:hypothetical protein
VKHYSRSFVFFPSAPSRSARHAMKQITAIPGARALSRSTSRSPGKPHVVTWST